MQTHSFGNSSAVVSVIIPAYNATEYIGRALESVLHQSYQDLEIIVVDDGSTDDTLGLLDRFAKQDSRIRIVTQTNAGVASARNEAIRQSTGKYVAPLDADDYWFPEKIEQQVAAMEASGDRAGLVYTWWVSIDENDIVRGSATRWNAEGDVSDSLLFINFIGNASVPLFRRSALIDVGLYNTDFRDNNGQGCEDWDITLRIAEKYDVLLTPSYLTGYRAVDDSMSSDSNQMATSFELMLSDLKLRRPDVNDEVIRWSRSRFYSYVASQCYNGRKPAESLRWLTRVVKLDPLVLTSPGILKLGLKGISRTVAAPVLRRVWPTNESWRTFRKRTSIPRDEVSLDQLLANPSMRAPSRSWFHWKPYDRVLMKRWKFVSGQAPPEQA